MAREPLQRKKFLKPNYDPTAKLSRLRRIPSTRNLAEGVKNFIRTNPLLVLRASRRIETSKGPKYAILLSTLLAFMGRPAFSQETSPVVVFTNPEARTYETSILTPRRDLEEVKYTGPDPRKYDKKGVFSSRRELDNRLVEEQDRFTKKVFDLEQKLETAIPNIEKNYPNFWKDFEYSVNFLRENITESDLNFFDNFATISMTGMKINKHTPLSKCFGNVYNVKFPKSYKPTVNFVLRLLLNPHFPDEFKNMTIGELNTLLKSKQAKEAIAVLLSKKPVKKPFDYKMLLIPGLGLLTAILIVGIVKLARRKRK